MLDTVSDPLDSSITVQLNSADAARAALVELTRFGLSAAGAGDTSSVRVRGWDASALRRRLGIALAGVDDLSIEWAATADLAIFYFQRRVDPADLAGARVLDVEDWEVVSDVEDAIRRSQPLPHRAPDVSDVDTLLQLVEAADARYSELILEHVDLAERVVAMYRAELTAGHEPEIARVAIVNEVAAARSARQGPA